MASQVICPQGHTFEPVPGSPVVCPQCGTPQEPLDSVTGVDETFKPLDELPPLPVPSSAGAKGRIPFQLSGYEILEELGRGGMGVVYKARQINLDRAVALKMMLGAAPEELARFKTEADAFAQLRHPNIVQIYEIGERDGQPYLALEFVTGGTLADHLGGVPVEPLVCAQFVETLARTMHFAHSKNIIHRDLKPANVLLQTADCGLQKESPSDPSSSCKLQSAIPKITDFGLAKRLDRESGLTRAGAVMGTPSYMAPEQAAGAENPSADHDAIGPAADIYALGAILYEMLTGRPPFRGVAPLETLRQVLHDEPVPPRRLQPSVPFDLETICLKCLAKEPDRRYVSADALADDLARFLAGQPILARPTSWFERTSKWIKRRPAMAALMGMSAIAALMLVGLAVGAYYNSWLQESLRETEKQRARADELFRLTRRYHYVDEMNQGQRFWRDNQTPHLLALLKRNQAPESGLPDLRSFEWHYLRSLCHSERLTFSEHQHSVTCVAFSPTENLVASGSGKSMPVGSTVEGFGEVMLWDADSGKVRHVLKGHAREVNGVAFSPDGQLLATASSDATVSIWKVATGERVFQLQGHDPNQPVTSVAFHPSGNSLASGSGDKTIKIWNVKTGGETRTLDKRRQAVLSLAFNRDGTRLLSGSGDPRIPEPGEIWEWDMTTGKARTSYRGHGGAITAVAFGPKDKTIIAATDRTIHLWNAGKEDATRVLAGHQDRITSLAFDKATNRLASGSFDQTVIVWDAAIGRELFSRKGHAGPVRGAAFSADGTRLISAAQDRAVKVWDADGEQEFATLVGHDHHVTEAAFNHDGTRLASGSLDHTVRVWDMDRRNPPIVLAGHTDAVQCVAFARAEVKTWHVVSGSDDGTIRFWDIALAKEVFCLNTPGEQVRTLAVNRDGTRLAYAGVNNQNDNEPAVVMLIDTDTKNRVLTLTGHASAISSVAFSADGKYLVSASVGNRGIVKTWDVNSGEEVAAIPLKDADRARAAFSPDGKWLAIANGNLQNGQLRIHDARTGKEELVLTGHTGMANALAFTPDGERLVTTAGKLAGPSQIKLWDVKTGQEVLTLRGPTGLVQSLTFSPDGRRLACGGSPLLQARGEIILWDSLPRSSPKTK